MRVHIQIGVVSYEIGNCVGSLEHFTIVLHKLATPSQNRRNQKYSGWILNMITMFREKRVKIFTFIYHFCGGDGSLHKKLNKTGNVFCAVLCTKSFGTGYKNSDCTLCLMCAASMISVFTI